MYLLTATALVLLVALHLLGAKTPAGTRLALLARSVRLDLGDHQLPDSADVREGVLETASRLNDLRSIPRGERTADQNAELAAATDELLAGDALLAATQRFEADAVQRAAWATALANGDDRDESRGPGAATRPPPATTGRSVT